MHAFGWDYVDDYDVRNENLVIKCYSGTAAEQYAKDNGFKCILLDTGEVIEKGEPLFMRKNIEEELEYLRS